MTEKKKKASKAERKKVLELLMGFYQVVLSVYNGSCTKFEDENLAALIIKAHLFEIINFQAKKATDEKLPIPEMTKTYNDYIDEWNALILTKEPDLKKIIKKYIEKGRVSYIS